MFSRRDCFIALIESNNILFSYVLQSVRITANSSAVYARIDTNLKERAEAILEQLGITPSALIQMTYSQVILNNGLPFAARMPYSAPVAIGDMTAEQLSTEITKGVDSLKLGRVSANDLDKELSRELGI